MTVLPKGQGSPCEERVPCIVLQPEHALPLVARW